MPSLLTEAGLILVAVDGLLASGAYVKQTYELKVLNSFLKVDFKIIIKIQKC